jgi:uncharacterized protein
MSYPSISELLNDESKPFFEATKENKLLIQYCSSCKKYQFYPRVFCMNCYSDTIELVEASGNGKVYSYTVVYKTQDKNMEQKVPYAVALIDLDEGVRLMSHVVDIDVKDIVVDMDVSVVFRETVDEYKLPQFVPR